jgi:hypothetical protein
MSGVEITITVQDKNNVHAQTSEGNEGHCAVDIDRLRSDTIKIFENWLNESKISKRAELEVLGAHLYQMIFRDEVRSLFERTLEKVPKGGRLRVQLSFGEKASDLASLPWEYLYYPDSGTVKGYFLSTNGSLVLSRYMPKGKERESLGVDESPLRILTVVSQPETLAPVIAEPVIDAIEKLADVKHTVLDKPTMANFLDKLMETRPHVLHFIGHGRFNKQEKIGEIAFLDPDERSLMWLVDSQFSECFPQAEWTPQLVFLHLCEGATVDFSANFAGLAPQLVRTGIPAVVAMQYPITNMAAIAFSRAFYRELANGAPVDQAVQIGRWRITVDIPNAYHNRVFGTPVLYMHSRDGIIRPGTGREEKPITAGKSVVPALPQGKSETKQAISAQTRQKDEATTPPAGAYLQPPGSGEFGMLPVPPNLGYQVKDGPKTEVEELKRQQDLIFKEGYKAMLRMGLSNDQQKAVKNKIAYIKEALKSKTFSDAKKMLDEYYEREEDEDVKMILLTMIVTMEKMI